MRLMGARCLDRWTPQTHKLALGADVSGSPTLENGLNSHGEVSCDIGIDGDFHRIGLESESVIASKNELGMLTC